MMQDAKNEERQSSTYYDIIIIIIIIIIITYICICLETTWAALMLFVSQQYIC